MFGKPGMKNANFLTPAALYRGITWSLRHSITPSPNLCAKSVASIMREAGIRISACHASCIRVALNPPSPIDSLDGNHLSSSKFFSR